jgi:glycosyltransferase involved in cell wall biosynthesis
MRIALIHNEYAAVSGEEIMVRRIERLLRQNGHEVFVWYPSSRRLLGSVCRQAAAFVGGIYNPLARRQMRRFLRETRPDLIQVQNLYPLLSPSILLEAKDHGIPIVMRCANYRLLCPTGLMMRDGRICRDCWHGREWNAVRHNCENRRLKSLAYALRNHVAHTHRWYLDTVSAFYAQTEFQRQLLIEGGLPADRISVIPNMVESVAPAPGPGSIVGFVGRLSPEKGVDTLLAAAKLLPEVPFAAAGSFQAMPDLPARLPANLRLVGALDPAGISDFYNRCRFTLLPSVCLEGFPSTILESMIRGLPVIASRIGAIPEIVEDDKTGFLFDPFDPRDLAEKVRLLWNNPNLCRHLGRNARHIALRDYTPENYYARLMEVYESVTGIKDRPDPDDLPLPISHEFAETR